MFIELTGYYDRNKITFNVNHIIAFWLHTQINGKQYTEINTITANDWSVVETPEEINAKIWKAQQDSAPPTYRRYE